MNRTQLNRINSNVEVLNRDYSTASVKEIARKQKQLLRTREAKMSNTKINELCSKKKLSVEEVTYLFMNDYNNFLKAETTCVLLKTSKHHFECSVITLIFFYNSSMV